MNIEERTPPRMFKVGIKNEVELSDCGDVYLENDEQVTFKTSSGSEYDFVKKSWGYYASPSLNNRLLRFNLRPVLIKNIHTQNYFFLVVEKGHENDFQKYLDEEHLTVVTWLDNEESLQFLDQTVAAKKDITR